jgi:hypothetical protein
MSTALRPSFISMTYRSILPVILALFFFSCEKDVDFKLNSAAPKLVVDAQIENGQSPVVILTNSLDYFSNINASIISNLFVHDAAVSVSDGTRTHRLKEYSVPVAPGLFFYFYGTDSTSLNTAITGTFNTTYNLNIEAAGNNYQAVTTIPILAKKPDSLWWKPAPFASDTNQAVVWVHSSDPPGLGNYVRYYTRRNGEPFLPGENSVFDDQVIDGTSYSVPVEPGIDRNNRVPRDSSMFRRGDTVTIKLCNIDRNTFRFWNTWEFAQQSIGNPFAQPGTVVGNVSNGALGAFCGYAADYRTLVIPR